MKEYFGKLVDNGCGGQEVWVNTVVNGVPAAKMLPLKDSLKVCNHSPTGFNWGYGGSGPAQTALAILLDLTGDAEKALKHYQAFKWEFVSGWGDRFSISETAIRAWLVVQEMPVPE